MAETKPADLNGDGKVTDKERTRYRRNKRTERAAAGNPMAQDTLSLSQLDNQAGFTYEFVSSVPELADLFAKAIRMGWTEPGNAQGQAMFEKAFKASKWYLNNNEWAREYAVNEARGGADWEEQKRVAAEAVKAEAVKIGAELDDAALKTFTEAYLANGWNRPGRDGFLRKALAGELPDFASDKINYRKGGAETIAVQLRDLARSNGVKFDESYFQSAARAVLADAGTIDDYAAEIRAHAASRYPIFKERIMAGENARDIASPYINRMAEILELDPQGIDLNDQWITKAIGGVGQDGKPTAMSFWDFEKELRRDDRWQYTKQAHNEVSNITREIVRMFGYGG